MARALVASLVVSLVVPHGAAADAQDADALLKRGTADMKTGDYEKACPALSESHKLKPTATSAFQSATCEAHAGRFKTATARYAEYLSLAAALPAREKKQQKERVETATRQRAELEPLIPAVTLSLSAGAPADTVVTCDGAPIERTQLGAPLALDPGEHLFTTQAPSGPVRERRVTLTASDKISVTLVVDAPAQPAAAAPIATAAPEPDRPAPPPPVESSGARRPLAYGALALGILGVAAGALTGILSMERKGVVDDNCDGATCNGAGKDAADTGLLLAHLSTIGFGVGVAGIATGVLLIVTEPAAAPAPPPSTASRGLRIGVAGRW